MRGRDRPFCAAVTQVARQTSWKAAPGRLRYRTSYARDAQLFGGHAPMLMRRAAGDTPSAPLRMTARPPPNPSPKPSSRLSGALRRARRLHPVWGLNVLFIATAVALYAGPVHGLQPLARPHLPWWSIAIAFAIAERCVVHLHFRRGAHSFSLGDIPIVFGLIFCSAEAFGSAACSVRALVMLFDRRLPPVKFVFNTSQFAVHACIALLVVHALAPVSLIRRAAHLGRGADRHAGLRIR